MQLAQVTHRFAYRRHPCVPTCTPRAHGCCPPLLGGLFPLFLAAWCTPEAAALDRLVDGDAKLLLRPFPANGGLVSPTSRSPVPLPSTTDFLGALSAAVCFIAAAMCSWGGCALLRRRLCPWRGKGAVYIALPFLLRTKPLLCVALLPPPIPFIPIL